MPKLLNPSHAYDGAFCHPESVGFVIKNIEALHKIPIDRPVECKAVIMGYPLDTDYTIPLGEIHVIKDGQLVRKFDFNA